MRDAIRVRVLYMLLIFGSGASLQAQTGTKPVEGLRFIPPKTVLLSGARVVVNAEQEPKLANLLIEDGKLTAVGAVIEPPPGAELIELDGKYIYPAFIDPLVEFDAAEVELKAGYWNDKILPQRTMDEVGDLESDRLEALRKAGVAAILACPSDGIIKGQSSVVLTGNGPVEQGLLRAKTFQHLQLYPSRRSRGYPNSPMGAVALIRQALADADWYAQARQAVAADPSTPMPEYNAALLALQPTIRGEQTVVADGSNELYALRADRLAREFSLKLIIRGSGREYRRLDAIAATNRSYIIPVDFPDAPEVDTRLAVADTTLQELMHWRLAPENPGRLDAAGVDFVLTGDGLSKPGDLLKKVRLTIERGLSQAAALRALTLGPAEMLGIDHLAGTLESGKLANFIITDGPLFEASSAIEETWVAGVRFDWEVAQDKDLRGHWNLAVAGGPSTQLSLELKGKPEKLTGKIGLAGAFEATEKVGKSTADTKASEENDDEDDAPPSVKVKGLTFDGYRLAGNFEAGEIVEQQSGAAIIGAVILPKDEAFELVGSIDWPDGSSFPFAAHLATLEQEDVAEEGKEPSADDESSQIADAEEEANESDSSESAEDSQKQLVACDINYPLGAYGVGQAPEQPEWLLIKNATLWTCGDAGILESGDMLIHQGVIESVGTDLEAPEGAIVVDATGMHISPGIIDCHSHMATDGGVNESGQAVTAEVRIGDFIDPNDITIYRQLAGGVTTSNILHGSANPIGGQNQVIKLRWGSLGEDMKMREAPAGIKFALGENVKQSSRPDSTRYPQTRMGVEQIMRDRFEAAIVYRKQWADWSADPRGLPPRRDYELDAIAEILEQTRWIHCHSYRQDEILTMLRTLDDYGITIGSLQHILEGYKVADAMAKHGATGSSFSDWWAYKFEVYDAIPYNGALMHRAGVVVSFNSDDRELARHLNHEAAKAVKYGGVSPEEALKFVTLNPAKQLRIDTWVGSLEPGKHADFVVWNRSPLSTLSVCTETWVDGRKYFDRQQDLERRSQDAELHRQLVQSILSTGAKTASGSADDDPSYWWARHDEFCHDEHDEHDDYEQHAGHLDENGE